MKELIYTGIFAVLGILFVILLVMMLLPDKQKDEAPAPTENPQETPAASSCVYIPGSYTTELVLGGQTIDVEVLVEKNTIVSIQLINLNDAVTTMYPLLQPTFDSLCEQIYSAQSLENISYSSDSKYTSLVLLEAIRNSLEKAAP